ncbi:hypothetical protein F0P96_07765 [Hymenobacter busanensis]|uniref:Uncharacterized protein n=1 Tax=Hymenobacter busanensis TaxID=2607656 RepID=A0A7L5A455_9BACT|nr:hypothetical protein [Hymenobacter busanensis]KAA9338709.1 hypothetical protein F0P96_07765 [Hymenobacter busanensis]QHJ08860.1 hypothetical protein GUY19_16835 [Hymenobacter busanensis]
MTTPLPSLTPITADEALQKIQALEPLRGYHVQGALDLANLATDHYTYFSYPLVIEHCRIDEISGSGGFAFEQPVTLRQAHFAKASFIFAYFLKGLDIEGCTFDSYLDFQAGGHNKPGCPVRLVGNAFKGFVNFFDCQYEAEVQIENNDFQEGTNLLGAPFNIPVTFDVPLVQTNNRGKLDHNHEGPGQLS